MGGAGLGPTAYKLGFHKLLGITFAFDWNTGEYMFLYRDGQGGGFLTKGVGIGLEYKGGLFGGALRHLKGRSAYFNGLLAGGLKGVSGSLSAPLNSSLDDVLYLRGLTLEGGGSVGIGGVAGIGMQESTEITGYVQQEGPCRLSDRHDDRDTESLRHGR